MFCVCGTSISVDTGDLLSMLSPQSPPIISPGRWQVTLLVRGMEWVPTNLQFHMGLGLWWWQSISQSLWLLLVLWSLWWRWTLLSTTSIWWWTLWVVTLPSIVRRRFGEVDSESSRQHSTGEVRRAHNLKRITNSQDRWTERRAKEINTSVNEQRGLCVMTYVLMSVLSACDKVAWDVEIGL